MPDPIVHLADVIREAAARKRALCVRGGGTKDFYGGEPRGDLLDTRPLRGIVSYEPTELVLTARAGTPLDEIEAALRENGQQLAFEPPHFDYRPPAPSATARDGLAVVSEAPRERIATLVDGYREAGYYVSEWDASGYPSGVYFAEIRSAEFAAVRKMLLAK